MKKLLLTASILLCCSLTNAQDTIVKRNGEQLLSKILEISATEVKYKKFDFLEGPDFIDSKSNIQLIKYSNGTKEEFEAQPADNSSKPKESNTDYYSGHVSANYKIESNGTRFRYKENRINELELHQLLLNTNDQQINLLVRRAKHAKGLQWIGLGGLVVGAVGGVSYVLGEMIQETNMQIFGGICGGVAIAFPVASMVFKHRRNVSNAEAIKLYNEKF